jgi:DNA-binding response OmpR family regulator
MNERILLVEDDDSVAEVVRLHLHDAGYRVGIRSAAGRDWYRETDKKQT